MTDQFDAEHEQLFTFKLGDGHEILMIRAVAKAQAKAIAELKMGKRARRWMNVRSTRASFYYEGAWHAANIYDRAKLHAGLQVEGPAIVGEMDSTTVVLPGYIAAVDTVGNLLINPASGSAKGGQ